MKKDLCHSCKYHYLLWDWDNGHHSICKLYGKTIQTPSRFDYPVRIPKWCEGKYERRENDGQQKDTRKDRVLRK